MHRAANLLKYLYFPHSKVLKNYSSFSHFDFIAKCPSYDRGCKTVDDTPPEIFYTILNTRKYFSLFLHINITFAHFNRLGENCIEATNISH